MTPTTTPYAATFNYVVGFKTPNQKIRFEQAKAEEAFGDMVSKQSQQTNVPDNIDPNQARIFFPGDKKSITISQVACQLQLNFEGSGISLAEQIKIARKNVTEFWSRAQKFQNADLYAMHGVVVEVNIPFSEPTARVNAHLHEIFIKTKPLGPIASVQITLGYKVKELFLNFTAATYESREFKMEKMQHNQFIDIESLELRESGITIKVDINNRSEKKQSINQSSPDELIDAIDHFLHVDLFSNYGFSLEGAVK